VSGMSPAPEVRTMTTKTTVYRICEDANGYHLSNDALEYLDCRGRAYTSRRHAIAALRVADHIGPRAYLAPSGRKVRVG